MAFTFNVNQTPENGSVGIYSLISTLVTAGWSKIKDSDGSTYSSVGAQVTSGVTGAGGLGNNSAWIIVQAPTVGSNQRSFCFQRGGGGDARLWRIKYSANAGFTGGTASATQTPSAADEIVICGAGTNVSPTFGNWFPNNNSCRWHIICGGALEFYSFIAFSLASGSSTAGRVIYLDVLAAGSVSPADPDPAMIGASYYTPFSEFMNTITTNTNPFPAVGWLGATNIIGNAVALSLSSFGGVSASTGYGVSPFSNKEVILPLFWYRPSINTVPNGVKGLSSLFRMNSNLRTNMDVFNLIGTRDAIYYQGILLPWNGSIPIL